LKRRFSPLRLRILGTLGVALAAALAAAPLGAAPPPARQPPAPLILIVDLQQILQDAKAAKGVQSVISQQYNVYSKEVAQQEDELQKARADLERQRTILAPEAFGQKARELQQRYDELDHVVQGRRQTLQQSLNEAMLKVKNAALEVVAGIVQERGANLVIEKQAIVFEAEGLDVTLEAIERLDQKLPSVPVNLPKPESEAPKGDNGAPRKPN
jgi:Skp family chaperone for outer membrane proteins